MSNRKGGEDDTRREDNYYVALCQKGDANAFRFLVEKYQKRVVNIAFRITGDYEEACETAQEAFLSAFRSIKKFRGDAAFSTWLTGITINHSRNRIKKMKSLSRHEGLSLDDPVESETGQAIRDHSSGEASAVEQLEKKELQAEVQECVAKLENEFREVLVLRDIQEFAYDEIRDILDIPDGTIKSRLFRAREAMKKCLNHVLGDFS